MDTQDYTVNADGWTAGKYCRTGEVVSLTVRQAQYENVTLKGDVPNPVIDEVEIEETPAPVSDPKKPTKKHIGKK